MNSFAAGLRQRPEQKAATSPELQLTQGWEGTQQEGLLGTLLNPISSVWATC
jgi:hypothetical protein